jgi:hypothetical protein
MEDFLLGRLKIPEQKIEENEQFMKMDLELRDRLSFCRIVDKETYKNIVLS